MIIPVTIKTFKLYELDSFDFELNWRQRCGSTYDLTDWDAMFRLFVSDVDRTLVYQITSPVVDDEGILLSAAKPNIVGNILNDHVLFDPQPGFFILEVTDPDDNVYRLAQGPVTYQK